MKDDERSKLLITNKKLDFAVYVSSSLICIKDYLTTIIIKYQNILALTISLQMNIWCKHFDDEYYSGIHLGFRPIIPSMH